MFYRECPYCGSNLDPGEPCDCQEVRKNKTDQFTRLLRSDQNGQIVMQMEDFVYAGN